MTVPQSIVEMARAGAESVYAYVERTAEVVPEGVRWQTLTLENEPTYSAMLVNGAAGISLFLSDYYRLTGAPRARELAGGACHWAAVTGPEVEGDGLLTGWAGIGLAWLWLAHATGDRDALAQAMRIADRLLAHAPGPWTTLYSGAAGEGSFLLRLAETTRDGRHLAGAVQRGEWLAEAGVRDGPGLHWPYQTDDEPWQGLGVGPGVAGIGLFLVALYQATRDERWAGLVREAAQTLATEAKPDHGGLNWAQTIGEPELKRCQICDGSPGIGLFHARAYAALSDPSFLETARAAGEATYAYGDVRHNPCLCHGLTGNAGFLFDLYRLTGEPQWLERAHDLSQRAFAYRTVTPEGDVWQADEPGFTSPEFMFGAAGAGHVFLRLWQPNAVRLPLV